MGLGGSLPRRSARGRRQAPEAVLVLIDDHADEAGNRHPVLQAGRVIGTYGSPMCSVRRDGVSVLSVPTIRPPGRSTLRNSDRTQSWRAGDGTWWSIVNSVAVLKRPASKGKLVPSAWTTSTFDPAKRSANRSASWPSISTAVNRGT